MTEGEMNVKPEMWKPERCHVKGGVVTEIVISYIKASKGFRYIVCKPAFSETCEKYIEKYREMGIDFTKINTESDKEWLRKIMAECEEAREVVYS
jgi:hypothetical protein